MKTQDRYAVIVTVIFCLYALTVWGLAEWCGPFWALVFGMVAFLCGLVGAFWRRLVVPLLVVCLAAAAIQPARAWMPVPPHKPSEQQPKAALLICGVVVIVVGGYVVWRLWKLCNKVLPPTPAPPPPPPTNAPPAYTNSAPRAAALPSVQFHDYDISGYPSAAPYTMLSWASLSSSTNLVDWRPECTITQWWCQTRSIVGVYTNGVLRSVSVAVGYPTTNTIEAVPMTSEPVKYFRSE